MSQRYDVSLQTHPVICGMLSFPRPSSRAESSRIFGQGQSQEHERYDVRSGSVMQRGMYLSWCRMTLERVLKCGFVFCVIAFRNLLFDERDDLNNESGTATLTTGSVCALRPSGTLHIIYSVLAFDAWRYLGCAVVSETSAPIC